MVGTCRFSASSGRTNQRYFLDALMEGEYSLCIREAAWLCQVVEGDRSAPLTCCSETVDCLASYGDAMRSSVPPRGWVFTPEAFQIAAGGPQTTGSFVLLNPHAE